MEVSTQMELDLAYFSEKVLNLEIFMLQVSDIASDYEILMKGPEELLRESIEKAFQFDILSGFLNSEVKEIERFMSNLQMDIVDAYKKVKEGDHDLECSLLKIDESLHHAEESLRNSQDQAADIRKQSDRFEKFLLFGTSIYEELENDDLSPMNSKLKLQTVEQQRHFLISLEKSLAREMDFEKKLCESKYNEEELKIKLQFAEKDAYYIEELTEEMMVKLFTAETSVEVLSRILKEFMRKPQIGQFSTSSTKDWEAKFNIENGFMKLSAATIDPNKSVNTRFELNGFAMSPEIDFRTILKKCIDASSKVSVLRERLSVPDEQPRESKTQLQFTETSVRESFNQQNILYYELGNLENIIEDLKEHIFKMQSSAESAEARYARLMKPNVELNDEVKFLRSTGAEKVKFLEKKLKESDMQLEHANASLEAIQENQKMLYTSLNDMEHIIEDLKGKVTKAENRAENAESKCVLLTETNLELNEELSFLRGRLETIEASLHQADMEKIATAKNISNRSRIIVELVKKLAFERERLQLQACLVTHFWNHLPVQKFLRSDSSSIYEKVNNSADHGNINSKNETLAESIATHFQVGGPISSTIYETKPGPAVSVAENSVPNIELVRTIDASQLNRKYVLVAFILLLLSILSVFLFHADHA